MKIRVFILVLLIPLTQSYAQRSVNVSPASGPLNEFIAGDTTALGERVDSNTIYVLEDGGTYICNGSIENYFPLTIIAEEGSLIKPKLSPVMNESMESYLLFRVRDDLTVKGLDISNTDDTGEYNRNTFRISSDGIRVILENCHINEDNQSFFRCDGVNVKLYIRNSVMSNLDKSFSRARGIDDRGNPIDTLVIENSTFYNIGRCVIRDDGSYIRYFLFNHNTVVNTGHPALEIGEVIECTVTNNLFIDCGILGTDSSDLRTLIELDSISTSELILEGVTQSVTISHNNFHLDQGYKDALPAEDTILPVPLFNPTAQAYIDEAGTQNTILSVNVTFADGPVPNYNMTSDWWALPNDNLTLPSFDRSGEPFIFSWQDPQLSQASTSGGPIGDTSWLAVHYVFDVNEISCYDRSDGEININILSGTPPYSYSWTNDSVTQQIRGLGPGWYVVTVMDALSHSKTDSVLLLEPDELTASIESAEIIYPPEGPFGAAKVVATGGTAPYNYIWDDENNTAIDTVSSLSIGLMYHVTVTDKRGCEVMDSIQLDPPEILKALIVDSTNITCKGFDNGTATVRIISGLPPFHISWDNELKSADTIATNLKPGEWYRVTITDDYGQMVKDSIMISEPEILSIAKDYIENICPESNTGEISITVSGGTPPYTFTWSNSQYGSAVSSLDTGTYWIDIVDNNGCLLSDTTVVNPISFDFSPELCMVTVDTNNNIIIAWEKVYGHRIVLYKIYRQGNDKMDLIGTVSFDSLSVFVDEEADPAQLAYLYRISAVDSCGTESVMSSEHISIHLSAGLGVNDAINLSWNGYTGYEFTNFKIYRGTTYSSMQEFRLVPNFNQSATDTDPLSGTSYYQIGAERDPPCNPSGARKSETEMYIQSFSNIVEIELEATGYSELNSKAFELSLIPNPVKDFATIVFENSEGREYDLYIRDVAGRTVRVVKGISSSEFELSRGALENGIYFIELRGSRTFRGRMILQ